MRLSSSRIGVTSARPGKERLVRKIELVPRNPALYDLDSVLGGKGQNRLAGNSVESTPERSGVCSTHPAPEKRFHPSPGK